MFAKVVPRSGDQIIVCMGPTGTGKSNFIDLLAQTKWSGSSLKSITNEVQAIRVHNPIYNDDSLVLVDTPGFDDTTRTDKQILQIVSDWLNQTYENGMKLSGILYLHRITDNRMTGTPYRSLRLFGELCGENAAEKVVLVTTMWDKRGDSMAERREKQLQDYYWAELICKGATTQRSDNKQETAWAIVKGLLRCPDQHAVLLQEEMVDLRRNLNETRAGRVLYSQYQSLLVQRKETIKALEMKCQGENNEAVLAELVKEREKIQAQLDQTFQDISAMKISIFRQFVLAFFGKKASSAGITIGN